MSFTPLLLCHPLIVIIFSFFLLLFWQNLGFLNCILEIIGKAYFKPKMHKLKSSRINLNENNLLASDSITNNGKYQFLPQIISTIHDLQIACNSSIIVFFSASSSLLVLDFGLHLGFHQQVVFHLQEQHSIVVGFLVRKLPHSLLLPSSNASNQLFSSALKVDSFHRTWRRIWNRSTARKYQLLFVFLTIMIIE